MTEQNVNFKRPSPLAGVGNEDSAGVKFESLLSELDLTKADLAKRLRIHPGSISRWGDKAPGYAMAYLELLLDIKRGLR
jgi:hypothetical protein